MKPRISHEYDYPMASIYINANKNDEGRYLIKTISPLKVKISIYMYFELLILRILNQVGVLI